MPHDTQIFVGKNRAGSSDYEIPSSAEIRVLAVNANFVDNGAGADWCPAVVMFSDSGSVIARALLPDVKVTAGDDAEVSWFPGVKPGGSGGGGATKAIVVYTSGQPWPDSGVPPDVGVWNLGFPYDGSVFNFANAAGAAVEILAPGKYLLWLTVEWDLTAWGTNVRVALGGSANNFGVVSANGDNAVGQGPYFQGRPPALWFAFIAIVPVGTAYPLEVFADGFQTSGADRTFEAQLMVWQLDSTPTP